MTFIAIRESTFHNLALIMYHVLALDSTKRLIYRGGPYAGRHCMSTARVSAIPTGGRYEISFSIHRLYLACIIDHLSSSIRHSLCVEYVSEHVSSICYNSPSDLHILRLSMS